MENKVHTFFLEPSMVAQWSIQKSGTLLNKSLDLKKKKFHYNDTIDYFNQRVTS